jgi:hypothetical protein
MLSTVPYLLFPLLLSAYSIQAVVHRIGVVHHRLPSVDGVGQEHNLPGGMAPLSDIATKEPFNTTYYGYALAGNISLGSPAQEFTVKLDFCSPNLYVLDKDAKYYSSYYYSTSSESTDVTGKQTYDPSTTNSLLVVNANFSSTYAFMNGSVVSDVLQLGDSLEAAVEFQDTSLVRSYMQWYSYDGVFGLSTVPAENASTTLLHQLQYSLDSPVYTFTPATDYSDGQLVLGGLAPDLCQGDSWAVLAAVDTATDTSSTSYPSSSDGIIPPFSITSASTTAVGDSNGCAQRVNTPLTVYIDTNYHSPIYTSYQVEELFIQASNATYNSDSYHYELTDDQMALAQPVYLNMDNGAAIQLHPEDYTSTDDYGTRYLNVYGYYNAHKTRYSSLTLGLPFFSRHCLSKNFHTGVWSLTDRVSST